MINLNVLNTHVDNVLTKVSKGIGLELVFSITGEFSVLASRNIHRLEKNQQILHCNQY